MIILIVILIFVALGLLAAFTVSATTGSAESIANSITSIEQARAMQAQAEATQGAVNALSAATFMDARLRIILMRLC